MRIRQRALAFLTIGLFAAQQSSASAPICTFTLLGPSNSTSEQKPSAIAAGDVNGDGKMDVVVANQQVNKYQVLLGNGDGTFVGNTSVNYTNISDLKLADFDEDGKSDLIITPTNSLEVRLGDGHGNFTAKSSWSILQNTQRIAIADLTGDHHLDIIVSRYGGVNVYVGDGHGVLTWTGTYETAPLAHAIAVADFNGDGHNDFVLSDQLQGMYVFLGKGDGTFIAPTGPLLAGDSAMEVVAGDFNGDGKADFLVANRPGSGLAAPMSLFLGNGDGTFQPPVNRGSLRQVSSLQAYDIDGDGDLDVIATSPDGVTVFINDGAGNFTSSAFGAGDPLNPPIYLAAVIADFDGDGGPDIATADFSHGVVGTFLNKCAHVAFTLGSTANPSSPGAAVTITATATPTPAAGATPTGGLTIAEGVNTLAAGTLAGTDHLGVTKDDFTTGSHALSATYSGDNRFAPAVASLTQVVQLPPFGAPTNLSATASSPASVGLTWIGTAGVDHYEVQRAATSAGPFGTVGTSVSQAFTDSTVSAGHVYLYRVRGISPSSTASAPSAIDLASTFVFTDPTITAQVTTIQTAHVAELRTAINAVRTAAGLSPNSWTDPSLPGVPIKAVHVTELRTALNQARASLGVAALTYTDPTLVAGTTAIRALHVTELRTGIQ